MMWSVYGDDVGWGVSNDRNHHFVSLNAKIIMFVVHTHTHTHTHAHIHTHTHTHTYMHAFTTYHVRILKFMHV